MESQFYNMYSSSVVGKLAAHSSHSVFILFFILVKSVFHPRVVVCFMLLTYGRRWEVHYASWLHHCMHMVFVWSRWRVCAIFLIWRLRNYLYFLISNDRIGGLLEWGFWTRGWLIQYICSPWLDWFTFRVYRN